MSFISYAQNFEDVMLRRALKHVPNGFYIDVGAWSPDVDSVTRAFYEMGWRGLNIEPNPHFHSQLCDKRPLDINLEIAVGDSDGVLPLIIIGTTGLSTTSERIASKHQPLGYVSSRHEVQVTTLLAVWRQHVAQGQDVHFLKIDVEGAEESVLAGCDWTTCRPWIVLVEATEPMEQTETYANWEPILLQAQYKFAYADGLNRYYVAHEHVVLLESFRYPPNVFDNFVLIRQRNAEEQALQAVDRADRAEKQLQAAIDRAHKAEEQAQQPQDGSTKIEVQAAAQLNHAEGQPPKGLTQPPVVQPEQSRQVTAPLRDGKSLFAKLVLSLRKGLNQAISYLIETFHRPLSELMFAVLRYPSLSKPINQLLLRYPALHHHLQGVAQRNGVASKIQSSDLPVHNVSRLPVVENLSQLSPRGLEIYSEIEAAIKNSQGRN